MKPTEEQIKKFWEWCGWHWEKYEVSKGCFGAILLAPHEEIIKDAVGYIPDHTPPIDLNNLFKLGKCKMLCQTFRD